MEVLSASISLASLIYRNTFSLFISLSWLLFLYFHVHFQNFVLPYSICKRRSHEAELIYKTWWRFPWNTTTNNAKYPCLPFCFQFIHGLIERGDNPVVNQISSWWWLSLVSGAKTHFMCRTEEECDQLMRLCVSRNKYLDFHDLFCNFHVFHFFERYVFHVYFLKYSLYNFCSHVVDFFSWAILTPHWRWD